MSQVSRRSFLSGVASVPAVAMTGRVSSAAAARGPVTTAPRHKALPFVAAKPAESLASAVGVVNHFHFGTTVYAQTDRVVEAIADLGVRHVRNRIASTAGTRAGFRELTRIGVKVHGVCGAFGDRENMAHVMTEVARSYSDPYETFSAFEGINEPNNNSGRAWVAETRLKTRDLFLERNRFGLSGIPIVAPALARVSVRGTEGADTGEQSRTLGDLTPYVDYGNIHVYPRGLHPSTDIDEFMGYQRAVCGDLPMMCTEGGYFNASHYQGGAHPTPEEVTATYLPQQVMEHWIRGNRRFFVYELLDDPDPAGNEREAHFGLVGLDTARGPWRPKAQYQALKNFIAILGDPGGSHDVGGMPLRVSGPPDVRWALVAKRSGARYVVMWRGVDVYDPRHRRAVHVDSQPVTLTFDGEKKVKLFQPTHGRGAVAVHRDVRKVDIPVGGELVIARIT